MVNTTAEVTGPQVFSLSIDAYDGVLENPTSLTTYKTYRAMRKDPTIALARAAAAAPILASKWTFESENEEWKDFIKDQLESMRSHILRTAVYSEIDYGWQGYEKVYAQEDSRIVLRRLKPLLQDLTDILVVPKTGAFNGVRQNDTLGNEVSLEVQQSLCLSFNVEGTQWYGNPRMENVRSIYDSWNDTETASKRYDKKIAGSHWLIKYPQGRNIFNGIEQDNAVIAASIADDLQSSGIMIVPTHIRDFISDRQEQDAWSVELITASGSSRASFGERQKYQDALKVRGLLLPERSILEGEFGTKAEAEAHANFALVYADLIHEYIAEQLNWHVVNPILRINFGDVAENEVRILPEPIADTTLMFLRTLYEKIISNPSGLVEELISLDLEELRNRLSVPSNSDMGIVKGLQDALLNPGRPEPSVRDTEYTDVGGLEQ